MNTVTEIMSELESLGSPGVKAIWLKHGIKEPFFGVKIGDLKPIEKRIKKDYQLAKDLYATGNADAMYLAGLIADDKQMSKTDLQTWVGQAVSCNISDFIVPWVAAGGNCGFELALEWIKSPEGHIASAGWATLSNLVALKPDNELDINKLKSLLKQVQQSIHTSANGVRSTMNNFVIALGIYVSELRDEAIAAAKNIGKVTVIKEGTACKVPDAIEYINKALNRGPVKKKKTVKC